MTLSAHTIQTIKATVPVLEEHGENITTVFYKNMFNNHPELLNIFNEVNQKRGKQQQALANMVYEAAKNINQLEVLLDEVKLIAEKHRGLQINPEHYPIVGKYLLLAIKEVLGVAATDEIMTAWEQAYGGIAQLFIDLETEMYQEAKDQVGGWDGFKDFVVVDKVRESDAVTSFYPEPKDGKVLPAYQSGQYLTIRVTIPGEEYMHIRHYTLSATSNTKQFRNSVKKEADNETQGKVSTFLHDHVEINDIFEASVPAGNFTLNEESNPITFISGGVGITPMISMLETLAKDKSDREITFVYAAQNESVHAFHPTVSELIKDLPRARYIYGYDKPVNKEGKHDSTGYVSEAVLTKAMKPAAIYYIVGPVPFMEHVASLLATLNVHKDQIRYELFGPAQDILKEAQVVS